MTAGGDVEPERELLERAGSVVMDVRLDAANAEDLPAEAQRMLAGDTWGLVRTALAGNPSLVADVQETIARNEDDIVANLHLARNPSLAPAVQRILADGDAMVAGALARNPSLLPELQEKLVTYREGETLCQLALNPSITREVQERLFEVGTVEVHFNLLENPNVVLSPHLLVQMLDMNERGMAYMDEARRTLTPRESEAWEVLLPSWTGTLGELLAAARVLS